ncbi:RdlA protein [Streptomyces sp. ISL-10]|uniref:rodlin n=1 Tax=Streptomyces sp. ISL-10 TaxID=2819172 RepID=UPI001BEACC8B|nr:rodlin [Streptomyces sp. ISL-10]MBT2365047.1 RdlA protein [Streptomyces sp. ISL-10]
MFKKVMATAALSLSVAATGATVAPQAMAVGDDQSTLSASGNNSAQEYGSAETHGTTSPQFGVVQDSLNKPCVALPAKANVGSLVGVVPVGVEDVPVLSAPQDQQCVENSTQAKGDEPLSHVLSDIPVLSGNGASAR